MSKYVETQDYYLTKIKPGRYIVQNSARIDIGQVVGKHHNWTAFGKDGSRVGTAQTRVAAAALLLDRAAEDIGAKTDGTG